MVAISEQRAFFGARFWQGMMIAIKNWWLIGKGFQGVRLPDLQQMWLWQVAWTS